MAKKLAALLLGTVMMAAIPALAATYTTCSVISIEDGAVILECTDTEGMVVGGKVKVKPTKKKTAVEGC